MPRTLHDRRAEHERGARDIEVAVAPDSRQRQFWVQSHAALLGHDLQVGDRFDRLPRQFRSVGKRRARRRGGRDRHWRDERGYPGASRRIRESQVRRGGAWKKRHRAGAEAEAKEVAAMEHG
jgi:hypothetical protein